MHVASFICVLVGREVQIRAEMAGIFLVVIGIESNPRPFFKDQNLDALHRISTHSHLVFLIYFVITPTPVRVDGTRKQDIHNHDDIGVILESAQDY